MSQKNQTIAVVNSNEDTIEMLRMVLQKHGFSSVVTGHVPDFKAGHADFLEFVRTHDPQVFVWDISIPYQENWRFLHLTTDLEVMKGRRFVLTTTNKRALESLVGPTEAHEIVGKPYDLEQIVKAVERLLG
jgi:CheY-like chemotaxis protein